MVFEKLKQLLSEQLGVDESLITMETNILEDLGADSLDLVELISAVEEEFNLFITDEHIRELTTVGEIVRFIEPMVR